MRFPIPAPSSTAVALATVHAITEQHESIMRATGLPDAHTVTMASLIAKFEARRQRLSELVPA